MLKKFLFPARSLPRTSIQHSAQRKALRQALQVESLESRRVLASVAVFDDAGYVDTAGFYYSESDNLQASLISLGHSVTPFTGIAASNFTSALSGKQVLAIPELEVGSLSSALSAAAKTAISTFVSNGGGLIIHAESGSRDEAFLNSVFGFSLSAGSFYSSGSFSLSATAAAGTQFAGGSATIPANDGLYAHLKSSLPAGSKSIYQTASDSIVTLMPYGSGQIVFMGWDWFNAAPVGSQNGNWLSVLNSAVTQVANVPPVAQPNGPYTVNEGASITLSSTGSSDADGSVSSYEWDLNYDASTFDVDSTAASPTFSAANLDGPTTRTIALRVKDNKGATSAVVTTVVTVANVKPTASLASAGGVNEGSPGSVAFSTPFDPAPADSGLRYAFDLDNDGTFDVGDGTYAGSGTSTSSAVPASYLQDGPSTRIVRGRVIDKDGGSTITRHPSLWPTWPQRYLSAVLHRSAKVQTTY